MKKAAITALILLLIMAGMSVWLFTQCRVEVVSNRTAVMEVPEDVFEQLRRQVETNSLEGIIFKKQEMHKAEDYQLCTYTIRLSNSTFLTADMLEVQITPLDSDALQLLSASVAYALPARSEGEMTVTMLTGKGGTMGREAVITYYIWGIPFVTKTIIGRS